MDLTGNKDTNRIILNELDDTDICNVKLVCKQWNTMCDEPFWINRIVNNYDIDSKILYGGNYYEIYKIIGKVPFERLNKLELAASLGLLSILEKASLTSYFLVEQLLLLASKYNQVGVIKYLKDYKNGTFLPKYMDLYIFTAVHNNNIEAFELLYKSEIPLSISLLNEAIYHSKFRVIKYLVTKYYFSKKVQESTLGVIVSRNNLEITRFLIENIEIDINELFKLALQNCDTDVIKCIIEHGYSKSIPVINLLYPCNPIFIIINKVLEYTETNNGNLSYEDYEYNRNKPNNYTRFINKKLGVIKMLVDDYKVSINKKCMEKVKRLGTNHPIRKYISKCRNESLPLTDIKIIN